MYQLFCRNNKPSRPASGNPRVATSCKNSGRFLTILALVIPLLLAITTHGRSAEVSKFASALTSRAQFDALGRVFNSGRFTAIPHVIVVIDREKQKIYYVNSKIYTNHSDFVHSNYLTLEKGSKFFEHNYFDKNRRFIFGTLAYRQKLDRYTYELFEGDRINSELLQFAIKMIRESFFAEVFFKPNSLHQEQEASNIEKLPLVSARELEEERDFEAFRIGEATGILRIVEPSESSTILSRDDIALFKDVPVTTTPVKAIITTKRSSPLSHIHMLARSWKIPDIFAKGADESYAGLQGKLVRLKTTPNGFSLIALDKERKIYTSNEDPAAGSREHKADEHINNVKLRSDLDYATLTDLSAQRAKDVIRFGAKSANLGEICNIKLKEVAVPKGFTIPFRYYAQFIKSANLIKQLDNFLADPEFRNNQLVRRKRLEELRHQLQSSPIDDSLRKIVLEKVHSEYEGRGLFVRSSTNAEDLPTFNGAGLYSTVPNVRDDDALIEAIKTVWASVWNLEAFEARDAARIDHHTVNAAVLIQEGVDADSAGVLITRNPFDPRDKTGVYINAKRGLGLAVVDGKKVPEQIIFRPRTQAVRVLTRSAEDTLLGFDEHGGIKQVRIIPDRAILTDATARRLAKAALAVQNHFSGRLQDMEWAIVKETIYILQSRPYFE